MNLFNSPQHGDPSSPSKPPRVIIQEAIHNLHTHFSTLFPHQNPNFLNPNLKFHLNNLQNSAKKAIEAGFSNFRNNCNLPLAQISQQGGEKAVKLGMSVEEIEERLAGVPVYALSNKEKEFVLVSGDKTRNSLGFFCFKEEDAVALLQQMRSMEPEMREGSHVVAVALNKVVQLKLDGVAFRLIPEVKQIKNAVNERRRTGIEEDSFKGIPVFQSKSLILRSQGKRYRPVFFRKEDLEKSLVRASREQRRMNPAYREGDIEVAVLEDIIDGMKESAKSAWADVVFIPPGFDVSTDPSHK